MERRTFSIIEAVKYGYKTFCNHIFLLLGVGLIATALVHGLPQLIIKLHPTFTDDWKNLIINLTQKIAGFPEIMAFLQQHAIFLIAFFVAYWIIICIMSAGTTQVCFDIVDTGSSSIDRLFSWVSRAHRAIAIVSAYFLVFFGIFGIPIGFAAALSIILPESLRQMTFFFVLPIFAFMIYLIARCMLTLYAFIDRQDGIGDAFLHSWRITRGNLLRIYATFLCSYIPAIPFVFLAMGTPWYYLALQLCGIIMGLSITYAYRQLSPEEEIEIF